MKKSYKFAVLHCANCAAKMEREINKLPGVEKAVVSFFGQKLTITACDEKFEEIVDMAEKVCKKIEPDCALER